MILYQLARKVNKQIKKKRKEWAGRSLSPVRRVEFVAPAQERVVAMTFDDGPCMLPPSNAAGDTALTDVLLDILAQYGAHATFDVIGSTAQNYPDEAGKLHSFTWGGMKYDHYPDIRRDEQGGAVACERLIARMIDEGHEISNHGYRHIIFGPMRLVYRSRTSFHTITEVVEDLSTLHELLRSKYGYEIRLSRPPHYIDRIPDGYTSYDAYKRMGYTYMASSFDGGGWIAGSGDYQKDVDAMIAPLRRALEADPDALNGKIIFQKDGYNMSRQTPIADALGPQLALLREYGYQVVSVGELLQRSMFEDLPPQSRNFSYVQALAQDGYCIGYRNNTFQPDRAVTQEELAVMTAPPELFRRDYGSRRRNETYRQALEHHPYMRLAKGKKNTVSKKDLLELCTRMGVTLEHTSFADDARVTRLEAMEAVYKVVQAAKGAAVR